MRRSQARSATVTSSTTNKGACNSDNPTQLSSATVESKVSGNNSQESRGSNSVVAGGAPNFVLPINESVEDDAISSQENEHNNVQQLPKEKGEVIAQAKANGNGNQSDSETDSVTESRKKPKLSEPKADLFHYAAEDETATQSQLPDQDVSVYFFEVLKNAGLMQDTTGKFVPKASLASLSSLSPSIRSMVRGGDRGKRFMDGLRDFAQDDNKLLKLLLPIRNDSTSALTSGAHHMDPSLMRVLLKVEDLQPSCVEFLLETFSERALLSSSDGPDDELDAQLKRLLSCLCWLDFIAKPTELADQLLQVLASLSDVKSRHLREAVQLLPEILPDSEHEKAVNTLLDMYKTTRMHNSCILDVLGDLDYPKRLVDDLLTTVTGSLCSAPKEETPVIVKFLISTCSQCSDIALRQKTIKEIRLRLLFLNDNNSDSIATLVVKELQKGFILYKDVCGTYLDMILGSLASQTISLVGNVFFLDVWILLALSRSAQYASKAKDGLKRIALLEDGEGDEIFAKAIQGHSSTYAPFLPELLEMLSSFIRVTALQRNGDQLRDFGIKLIVMVFLSLDDVRDQQEVILQLVCHCAQTSNKDETNAALEALARICSTSEGAIKMKPFASYVKSLLNEIERMDLHQARTLFRICSQISLISSSSRESSGDDDELRIFLRKLLSCPEDTKLQMLGIVGTCQYVGVLTPFAQDSDSAMRASAANVQEAITIIDQLMRSTYSSLKFDELAILIEKKALDERVVDSVSKTLYDAFEEFYLFDGLVKQPTSSSSALTVGEMFALDEANLQGSIIRIYSLVSESLDVLRQRNRLMQMTGMLRCVVACSLYLKFTPEDEDLGVEVLYESALELPKLPEPGDSLTPRSKEIIVLSYLYACDWMRETISAMSLLLTAIKNLPIYPTVERALAKRLDLLIECERCFDEAVERFGDFASPPFSPVMLLTGAEEGRFVRSNISFRGGKTKPAKANGGDEEDNDDDDDNDGALAPKSKKKRRKAESDDDDDADSSTDLFNGGGIINGEDNNGESDFDKTKVDESEIKSRKAKTKKDDSSPQAWIAARRQLSPTCLHLLTQSSVGRLLSAEACCYILTAMAEHYESLTKCAPSRDAKRTLRSLDFSIQEMVQLLPLKSFRTLGDKVCDSLSAIAMDPESMSDWSSMRAISAFDAVIRILAVSVRLAGKNHPTLLQILRGFTTNDEEAIHLKRTATKLEVALLKDDKARSDAKELLADVASLVVEFLASKASLTGGVFSTDLGAQNRLLGLLGSLSPILKDDSLKICAKLCETLLKRDWAIDGNPGQHIKQLIDLALYFARGEDADLDLLESLEREMHSTLTNEDEDEENPAVMQYPLLTAKTLPIFYQACLSHLSSSNGTLPRAPFQETSLLSDDCFDRLRKEMRIFAALILLTRAGSSDKKLFRPALKFGKSFLDGVVKKRFRLVSSRLKSNQQECFDLINTLQKSTRQINNILAQTKSQRDAALLNLAPGVRKTLEAILLMWRKVLKEHNCEDQFNLGNLKARRADGSELAKE